MGPSTERAADAETGADRRWNGTFARSARPDASAAESRVLRARWTRSRGVRDSRPVGGLCRRGFVAAGPGFGVDTTAGADATDREGGLGNDAEHASPARRAVPARPLRRRRHISRGRNSERGGGPTPAAAAAAAKTDADDR